MEPSQAAASASTAPPWASWMQQVQQHQTQGFCTQIVREFDGVLANQMAPVVSAMQKNQENTNNMLAAMQRTQALIISGGIGKLQAPLPPWRQPSTTDASGETPCSDPAGPGTPGAQGVWRQPLPKPPSDPPPSWMLRASSPSDPPTKKAPDQIPFKRLPNGSMPAESTYPQHAMNAASASSSSAQPISSSCAVHSGENKRRRLGNDDGEGALIHADTTIYPPQRSRVARPQTHLQPTPKTKSHQPRPQLQPRPPQTPPPATPRTPPKPPTPPKAGIKATSQVPTPPKAVLKATSKVPLPPRPALPPWARRPH